MKSVRSAGDWCFFVSLSWRSACSSTFSNLRQSSGEICYLCTLNYLHPSASVSGNCRVQGALRGFLHTNGRMLFQLNFSLLRVDHSVWLQAVSRILIVVSADWQESGSFSMFTENTFREKIQKHEVWQGKKKIFEKKIQTFLSFIALLWKSFNSRWSCCSERMLHNNKKTKHYFGIVLIKFTKPKRGEQGSSWDPETIN